MAPEPQTPPQTYTYVELLRASPLPRRLTRRFGYVFDLDGNKVPASTRVAIGDTPHRFRAGKAVLEAHLQSPRVLALHKPTGFLTSRVDGPTARSVFELLPAHAQSMEPVGRLDAETTGLLLFTTDGQLLHRLTHPKREIPRTYRVTVANPPRLAELERLQAGELTLRDGHTPRPVQVSGDATGVHFEVTLIEGKYHEVRRMFAAVGAPVTSLTRVSYAGVALDDPTCRDLNTESRWVELPEQTIRGLYEQVALAVPEPSLEVRTVPSEGTDSQPADDAGSSQ